MRFGRLSLIIAAALALGVAPGCDDTPSDGDGDVDGDVDGDASSPCASDEDCDDGLFCDGVETCAPGSDGADLRGCLAGDGDPCPEGVACNEVEGRCDSECGSNPDADGDGHDAINCGGDDCDDGDAGRFPGNVEVCDAEGHDDDCDPSTLGGPADRDGDGDGYVSERCCNRQSDGTALCGDDCNDEMSGINPGATDDCNGRDDDCDGDVDEEPTLVFYRDIDNDNYGDDDESITACSRPEGFSLNSGDCDDTNPAVNPGEPEGCDGFDNDCDGAIDEDCSCSPDGATQECGEPDGAGGFIEEGECEIGRQTCVMGSWTACVGGVVAGPEHCDDRDNDCDGTIDEGFDCRIGTDVSCTTSCGTTGSGSCTLDCSVPTGPACHPPDEICNGVDDDCNGLEDEAFPCPAGHTVPCTTSCGTTGSGTCSAACALPTGGACVPPAEVCNGVDDDCDGAVDEGLWCSQTSPATADLRGVWGANDSDVMFVGPAGYLYRFTGSAIVEEPLAASLTTLGQVSDIWGVFANVSIMHVGPRDVIDAWACGTFGTAGGVFYMMNLHTEDDIGSWAVSDYPASEGACVAVSGQESLVPPFYGDPFYVVAIPNATGVIWRRNFLNGGGWQRDASGTTRRLNDIDLTIAVGNMGTIVRCDDIYDCTWSTMTSPTTENLRGIDRPWAVGDNGTTLHEDGLVWSLVGSGTTRTLRGVTALVSGEAWAVGDNGTVLHWTGALWQTEASGTTADLYAVDATDDSIWAVGDGGTILRRRLE